MKLALLLISLGENISVLIVLKETLHRRMVEGRFCAPADLSDWGNRIKLVGECTQLISG